MNHLLCAIALGEPFLGYTTRQGTVLLLAFEEHEREIRQRLRLLGGDRLNGRVKVFSAPLPYGTEAIEDIVNYVQANNVRLVIIDTLPFWLRLRDENSASETLEKIAPLLHGIRKTKAAWLALAHTRKGGGSFGEEVRGSSALITTVDVGLTLERSDTGSRRTLKSISRYPDTPRALEIILEDGVYRSLGGSAEAIRREREQRVLHALTAPPQTLGQIGLRVMMKEEVVRDLLEAVRKDGVHPVERTGRGVKGDPHRYATAPFVSSAVHAYREERKSDEQTTET